MPLFFRKRLRFRKQALHKNPAKRREYAEFEIDKWTISEFILQEIIPITGVHPFPLDELLLMTAAVCYFRPAHLFEWGTNIGLSARIFYESARNFNLSCQIHSIDLPDNIGHPEHPHRQRGLMVRQISSVKLYQGDGVTTALKLYERLTHPTPPFFFLDGDHSYESVKREIITIMQAVPNAPILIHDTFYQSPESGYNIGPYQAICDANNETGSAYKQLSTSIGLPGMTLLYKKIAI